MKNPWSLWQRFWFDSPAPERMRLFRILFGALLFVFYCVRSLDLSLYFSNSGIAHVDILPDIMSAPYRWSVFIWFPSDRALWFFNGVYLVSLFTLTLGWLPRPSAIVALLLHISFLHRNPAGTYGADTIAVFYLFYLCLADYRPRTPEIAGDFRSLLGSVAYRLCQLQLCVIYAYSGTQKLKGGAWWQGDALWIVAANAQLSRFDPTPVLKWWIFPYVIVFSTYVSLIWEIYFPVLVWVPQIRRGVLIFGIVMHLGIGLFMNIPFFGCLMMLTYSLFLDAPLAHRVYARLIRIVTFSKVIPQAAERYSV